MGDSSTSWNHDIVRCHEASEIRRHLVCKLKCLAHQMDCCDRYGKPSQDIAGDRFPPDWAVPLISYPMTKVRDYEQEKLDQMNDQAKKPWEKAQDVKVMGGKRVIGCACGRRNGLQADCELPECQGNELCLIRPYPLCPPSGNADMYVTPEQADKIFSYLTPIDYDTRPSECKENEPCSPKCVECNASLRDICKWNPKFFNSGGGNGGGNGGGYGGNGYGGGNSYNCAPVCYAPCYPYASWCYPPC